MTWFSSFKVDLAVIFVFNFIIFYFIGASIGDNLSQIEIYENGLKKAENFEVV